MKSKAQLESVFTWIIALILIFSMFIIWMAWNKPYQTVDGKLSPLVVDYEGGGKNIKDLLQNFRNNQKLVPVLMMAGVLVWAIMSSLKKDPNYPTQ